VKEEERSKPYRVVNLREMNEVDGYYFVINEKGMLRDLQRRITVWLGKWGRKWRSMG